MSGLGAGPELDAMIAQEIFGHDILGIEPCERDYDGLRWSTALCDPDCEWAEPRPLYVRGGCCDCDLIAEDDEYPPKKRLGHYWTCLETAPMYSSHILWAWEVVDKFMLFSIQKSSDGWRAICVGVEARAETAPLAICRAALKCIRGES